MWTRKELKDAAKQKLRTNYWLAFVITLITSGILGIGGSGSGATSGIVNYYNMTYNLHGDFGDIDSIFSDPAILTIIIIVIIGIVLFSLIFTICYTAFVSNPIMVGSSRFFLNLQDNTMNIKDIFLLFAKGRYLNAVKVLFFKDLYLFLWSLLIIPVYIKMYEYRMLPYILAENPNMDKNEAFALTKQLMHGHKFDTFVLDLSFLGWWFLSLMTCGIGFPFLLPYINATNAELYLKLKQLNTPNNNYIGGFTNEI